MPATTKTAMTTATFRLPPELKARVDNLAKMTRRSPSSFYSQLVEEHIGELEGKGLSFLTLTNAKEEKLLLVYRRKRLWEELQDETAQRLLQMLGYPRRDQGWNYQDLHY